MATKAPKPPSKPNSKAAALTAQNVVEMQPAMTKRKSDGAMVGLNFQVPAEFRRDFKQFAAAHDMSMVEVLKDAFDLYKTKYE